MQPHPDVLVSVRSVTNFKCSAPMWSPQAVLAYIPSKTQSLRIQGLQSLPPRSARYWHRHNGWRNLSQRLLHSYKAASWLQSTRSDHRLTLQLCFDVSVDAESAGSSGSETQDKPVPVGVTRCRLDDRTAPCSRFLYSATSASPRDPWGWFEPICE
jgi:hypothetical protein